MPSRSHRLWLVGSRRSDTFESLLAGVPWECCGWSGVAARVGISSVAQYRLQVDNNGGDITVSNISPVGGSPGYGSPQNSTGEIILRVDWSDLDGGIHALNSTPTGDVANVLANYLETTQIGGRWLYEAPIHLVGHSRGASLITVLAERLGESGIWVDQFTILDPHPVDGVREPFVPTQPDFGDGAISVWDNIMFADNYWRTDGDHNPDFTGEYVAGAFNTELNENLLEGDGYQFLSDLVGEHADTHLWYHGTVDSFGEFSDGEKTIVEPTSSDWYSPSAYLAVDGGIPTGRDDTGFAFSRIGGYSRPSAGLVSFLGGSASRDPVPSATPEWANVGYLDVESLPGGLVDIDFFMTLQMATTLSSHSISTQIRIRTTILASVSVVSQNRQAHPQIVVFRHPFLLVRQKILITS